jgi:hypothetical protein
MNIHKLCGISENPLKADKSAPTDGRINLVICIMGQVFRCDAFASIFDLNRNGFRFRSHRYGSDSLVLNPLHGKLSDHSLSELGFSGPLIGDKAKSGIRTRLQVRFDPA